MTALTDRYVWAVLRAVPRSQRTELEPEIRALVADAIEARSGQPAPDGGPAPTGHGAEATEVAERAALAELGDPRAPCRSVLGAAELPHRPDLLPRVAASPDAHPADRRADRVDRGPRGQPVVRQHGRSGDHRRHRDGHHGHPPDAVLGDPRLRGHRARGEPRRRSRASPGRVDDLPELPDDGRISIVDAVSTVVANVVVVVPRSCGSSSSHRSSSTARVTRCSTRPCGRSGSPSSSSSRCSRSCSRSCSTCAAAGRGHSPSQRRARRGLRHPGRVAAAERPAAQPGARRGGRVPRPMARGWMSPASSSA